MRITIIGMLKMVEMQGRLLDESDGMVKVELAIPAEQAKGLRAVSANAAEAYSFFDQTSGLESLPFVMTIGDENLAANTAPTLEGRPG